VLGEQAGISGTYTLSNGSLSAENEAIGYAGTGVFNQSAGTNNAGNLVLGVGYDLQGNSQPGATGTYNLSGTGVLSAGYEIIGGNGTGIFTQTGGSNTVSGTMEIGTKGRYSISGGVLSVVEELLNKGEFFNNGGYVSANVRNEGIISGSGTFTGNVTNVGTVSPGSSPGTLTITGNYTQDVLGKLLMELAGYAQGTEYDFLNIMGNATLAGTLDVDLLGGFIPLAGSSFHLLHAGGLISGTFSNLELPYGDKYWSIIYSDHDIYLKMVESASVPEPSTLLLLGLALIGLAGIRRKYKN
jgi:hypothetical protein